MVKSRRLLMCLPHSFSFACGLFQWKRQRLWEFHVESCKQEEHKIHKVCIRAWLTWSLQSKLKDQHLPKSWTTWSIRNRLNLHKTHELHISCKLHIRHERIEDLLDLFAWSTMTTMTTMTTMQAIRTGPSHSDFPCCTCVKHVESGIEWRRSMAVTTEIQSLQDSISWSFSAARRGRSEIKARRTAHPVPIHQNSSEFIMEVRLVGFTVGALLEHCWSIVGLYSGRLQRLWTVWTVDHSCSLSV